MESEIELDPLEPTSPEQNLGHGDLESVYAPFVRRDVYGRFGCGELPWMEKMLIAFALVTLVPLRVAVAANMLAFYYLLCRVCTFFQEPNKDGFEQEDYAHMHGWRRAVIVNSGKFLSRIFLFVLGFYRINEINVRPQVEVLWCVYLCFPFFVYQCLQLSLYLCSRTLSCSIKRVTDSNSSDAFEIDSWANAGLSC